MVPVLGAVSLAALACSSAGPSDGVPSTTQPAKDARLTATAEPTEVATVVLSPTATSEPVAEVENDTTADTGGNLASAAAEPSSVSRDVGEAVKGGDSKAGQDEPLAAILRELNPAGPKAINPQRYQQLLPRDAICPIYEPTLGGPGAGLRMRRWTQTSWSSALASAVNPEHTRSDRSGFGRSSTTSSEESRDWSPGDRSATPVSCMTGGWTERP